MVDIGTNSMRLLIRDSERECGRWVEVTGLGHGVDATGELGQEAIQRTIEVLERFGARMDEAGVEMRSAMATSATRDASNRELFLDRAEGALGVRPEVIDGEREGALAYSGATSDVDGDWVVSDIGGGSTEFVTSSTAVSIDIGSVRLTDRWLPDRPSTQADLQRARRHVASLFKSVGAVGPLLGVAGTWTSLAAIHLRLDHYDPVRVHHARMGAESLHAITEDLASRTVAETEEIPSLDPKRAPVILAGAVIAGCVMEKLDVEAALIGERDTLDGLAMELLGLR